MHKETRSLQRGGVLGNPAHKTPSPLKALSQRVPAEMFQSMTFSMPDP